MLRPLRLSPAPAGVSLPNTDYLRRAVLSARNDGVATFRACYLASKQFHYPAGLTIRPHVVVVVAAACANI
jgi:hypothetical protein